MPSNDSLADGYDQDPFDEDLKYYPVTLKPMAAPVLQGRKGNKVRSPPEVKDMLYVYDKTIQGDSRRRDCHFADAPSPSLLKSLLKVERAQQNDSLVNG